MNRRDFTKAAAAFLAAPLSAVSHLASAKPRPLWRGIAYGVSDTPNRWNVSILYDDGQVFRCIMDGAALGLLRRRFDAHCRAIESRSVA